MTFEPNEQELLTYGDRDGVDHPREVTVGRDYALYARCRGESILVRVEEMQGSYPWLPPCDGKTNRLVLADGPKQIVVYATGPDSTRWTFAVVNIKASAK
ncbi:hypothetical protein GCM10009745_23350 [Kribbella yunnanensis]|uniref:Uncharacterized protein n=1 Tax=Kribbella yunnanensis TaxID=190194 RepID=A0ABP4SXQ2_9ACTN